MTTRLRPARPNVSASWDEGRFFDRWMYVHLLCGLSCGFANALLRWPVGRAIAVTTVLLVAWEVGEVWFEVHEAWENRVIDVLIGLAGAVIALAILPGVARGVGTALFAGTTALFLAGDVLGWRAYRRRQHGDRRGARQSDGLDTV